MDTYRRTLWRGGILAMAGMLSGAALSAAVTRPRAIVIASPEQRKAWRERRERIATAIMAARLSNSSCGQPRPTLESAWRQCEATYAREALRYADELVRAVDSDDIRSE